MLSPTWPFTPLVLWVVLLAVLAVLVLRAVRRDRKEFRSFKTLRSTVERQKIFRKWLRESFLVFGGLSVVLLVLAWQFVGPFLSDAQAWPFVAAVRSFFVGSPSLLIGLVVGVVLGLVAITVFGARAARAEKGIVAVGDIGALLPRNRQELLLGGLLSVNAGLVEELMFRLAVPTVIYGATGSAIAAVVASLVLFGVLHIYQGVSGVVGTAIIGTLFMALYLLSGSIVVPMIVQAVFDLRTLVIIPAAVYGVHKIDGVKYPYPLPHHVVSLGDALAEDDAEAAPEGTIAGEAAARAGETNQAASPDTLGKSPAKTSRSNTGVS